MDRDAGESDRQDEALQGDTGMIGRESEEPGPGRDTSLTDPDPAAAGTDQPRSTVAMSEGDPMRTRLGSHVEGAGAIGHDVAASEEGATQQTPADDRPGYAPERPLGDEREPGVVESSAVDDAPYQRGPDEPTSDVGTRADDAGPTDRSVFAEEPAKAERSLFATDDAGTVDRSAYADETTRLDPAPSGGAPGLAGYEGEPGGAGMVGEDERDRDVPAAYTGEEADVTGRPEYADRAEGTDRPLYQDEPQRADRPGGGGSLFTDEEPERLDRPGPQEPGVDEGVYDQESDQARQQRPTSDGR